MDIAVVFPGQGAQYPGMGQSLYRTSEAAKIILDAAGEELKELCFEGDPEVLKRTDVTQPCMYAVDMAAVSALREALPSSFKIRAVAGFSLGEYAALAFARAMEYEDALTLVRARGKLMNDTAGDVGGMVAAIGDTRAIEALCEELSSFGLILPVNYNCPGQTVVAGEHAAIKEFTKQARPHGLRAIPLKVSGPFHSPLMSEARKGLEEVLRHTDIRAPYIPVYANATAQPYDSALLKETMLTQMTSPVHFEETIVNMHKDGIDVFVECGPGKTLSGFIKRILPSVRVFSVEDEESLSLTLEGLMKEAVYAGEQIGYRNWSVSGHWAEYSPVSG